MKLPINDLGIILLALFLAKPEGAFVGVRKDIKFKNFIKIRANFRDKLSESADNI